MPNNKVKFRYGICQNSHMEETGKPCPLCQSKEIQRVIATKELVCSECKAKLKEIPRPATFWEKYGKMIIAAIAVLVIGGCAAAFFLSGDKKATEPISVALNHVQKTLKIGEQDTLVATITPESSNASIIWQTGADNIVKVHEGIVEAVTEGSDSVIVQVLLDGEKASVVCNYTVEKAAIEEVIPGSDAIYITQLSFKDIKNLTLKKGDTKQLDYVAIPEQNNETLVWESSDPSVVTVENGLVTAVKKGKVQITVKAKNVSSNPIVITVTENSGDNGGGGGGTLNLGYGVYKGDHPGGKPDGSGVLTFKQRHLAGRDFKSGEQVYAEPGEYIDGIWGNGYLQVGTLFKKDGNAIKIKY